MIQSISHGRCPGCVKTDLNRRRFLQDASAGFGWLALAGLLADEAGADAGRPARLPHFQPKVRSVIFCFMDGGPSHVDTFDPKPMLKTHEGQRVGDHLTNTLYTDPNRVWLRSPWKFRQRGESGAVGARRPG